MMRGRTALTLTLCTLSVLASACGVPQVTTPHIVPTNVVSDSIVDDVRTSPLQPSRDQTVFLYFIRDRRMYPRLQTITVPALDRAADLAQDVIDKLLAGPSATERKAGVQSLVNRIGSTDTRAPIVINLVTDGTVRVDLGATGLSSLSQEDQILALGQIVFSLTSLPGVAGVVFLKDTVVLTVPTGQGPRKEVFASMFECAERGTCSEELANALAVPDPQAASASSASASVGGAVASSTTTYPAG